MNICDQIKNQDVNPIGLKNVELNFLYQNLVNGSSLCIGEGGEGGWEGVSPTVLYKNPNKTIVCTDIAPLKSNSFISKNLDKITFIHKDFIEFDENIKYDNVVCINVLEHFGFQGMPDSFISLNHDLKGLQKMLKVCNDRIILTIPFDFRPFNDNGEVPCGRHYTPERTVLLKKIAKDGGFVVETEITIINENKSFNLKQITDDQFYNSFLNSPYNHEYLKLMVFKKMK